MARKDGPLLPSLQMCNQYLQEYDAPSSTAIDGINRLRHPIAGSKIAKSGIRQMLYEANSSNINPTKFSGYTV